MICLGSVDEWVERSDVDWSSWSESLGSVAAEEGVAALTLFPIAGRGSVPPRLPLRQWSAQGVAIRALCEPDGRHRLAEIVNSWPPGQALTEETLGLALTGPGGEPDVVAVVGSPGRLPSALVWELAYAEIVDVDRSWAEFGPDDLRRVMAEFRTRRRRFGGLVDESADENGSG